MIRRKLLYLYDTDICYSVWVASGLLFGMKSNQQTRRHLYRVTNTSVVQVQQFSPDYFGHMEARNM